MHGLSTALPQKTNVRIARVDSEAPTKTKKAQSKTRRVFEEVELSAADRRAVDKAKAEIARGEYYTLEELKEMFLK